MIKKLLLMMAVVAMTCCMAACGGDNKDKTDDDEKDIVEKVYTPVSLRVFVEDKAGVDLLNPDYADNLVGKGMTITYRGKKYDIRMDYIPVKSTAVVFEGAYLQKNAYGKYLIYIGEWDGSKQWTKESVTLNWPDGATNELSFTLSRYGGENANCFLDGVRVTGSSYNFTK